MAPCSASLYLRPRDVAGLLLPLFLLLLAPPSWGQDDEPTVRPEGAQTGRDDSPTSKAGGLRMSRAVVCSTIDGYEDYKPLPGASQTSEEKLLVYYRPLRYKIESVSDKYHAHLTQDAEIRKKGSKAIVRQKKKLLDYNPKTKDPPRQIYLRNTISLKGLSPGDYELTILLHDELDRGSPPSRQVVKFTIVPPGDPRNRPTPAKPEAPPPADNNEDPPPER
ncbi:MAG: hypothetical protein ACYC61_10445 [Isosphaeraceae bacterium]